jgi:hypothetical protein
MDAPGAIIMIISVFDPPHFTFWNTAYTAIGAAVFWGRNGRTKLKVYYLSYVFDLLEFPEGRSRRCTEFVIFIVLGCLVGIGIAKPGTVPQALTAGFAWTGFFAKRG